MQQVVAKFGRSHGQVLKDGIMFRICYDEKEERERKKGEKYKYIIKINRKNKIIDKSLEIYY